MDTLEPQQPGEKPQLGNLKICPKCGIWCLEFDPHQQAWKCLNKECSAIYRNGVPEVEPQHFKFSEVMETRMKPQQTEGELATPEEISLFTIAPTLSSDWPDTLGGQARDEAVCKAQRVHMIAQGYHLPKDCCIGCTLYRLHRERALC
jgi:hypothetical protein